MKKFAIFISLILTTACTHKEKKSNQVNISNCFKLAGDGRVKEMEKQWSECQHYVNYNGTNLLMMAASRNKVEMMEYLVNKGDNINEQDLNGDTPLHYAVVHGQRQAVIWLIDRGAQVDAYNKLGVTPLMLAFVNGKKHIVELLIEKPFNVNAQMEDGWTVLFFATRMQDIRILKRILELGANPHIVSSENETALDLAREQKWQEGIETLANAMKSYIPKK